MSTSVSSVVSHFPSAENGFTTTTSGSTASGATTVGLNSVAGYTNGEIAVFVIEPTSATAKQTFTGVIDTSGVQVTSVVWTAGTNQTHAAGVTVVDYATATHISMMSKGLLVEHEQDGTHKAITAPSIVIDDAGTIEVDTVNEATAANGVSIDGLSIKDSKLVTSDSVVTANITDANVTMAKLNNPYTARVYLSANQNLTDNVEAKIQFDTESFDSNSNFDSTTNYRYTAPVDGIYLVQANCRGGGSNACVDSLVGYQVNGGSTVNLGRARSTGVTALSSNGSDLVSLSATDYIEFYATINSSTGNPEIASGATASHAFIMLVQAT